MKCFCLYGVFETLNYTLKPLDLGQVFAFSLAVMSVREAKAHHVALVPNKYTRRTFLYAAKIFKVGFELLWQDIKMYS